MRKQKNMKENHKVSQQVSQKGNPDRYQAKKKLSQQKPVQQKAERQKPAQQKAEREKPVQQKAKQQKPAQQKPAHPQNGNAESRNSAKKSFPKGNILNGHSGKAALHNDGKGKAKCPSAALCGGCSGMCESYEESLKQKETRVRNLLKGLCPVAGITGMENPFHYRNKVTASFQLRGGEIRSGIYQEGTHKVIQTDSCLIENETAGAITAAVRKLAKSFKIRIYNEDTGFGLLRHVMVRTAHETGQVMVILVTASPIFPSKNNFVKALRAECPEISTIVLNINDRDTSMVLGERNIVLYGKGYIEDRLCGLTYRISPNSFYQVNSVQTEALYRKAIFLAALTGKERVIDAYCGIGTIGMTASLQASEVIGIELNPQAVRDARINAERNGLANIRFIEDDAAKCMVSMAERGEHADVLFMDPPRSGSTETFLSAAAALSPSRIVYISCGPESLARDLKVLKRLGYEAKECSPFDCFCWTEHVETVCLLTHKG